MKDVSIIKRIMELKDDSLREILWRLCYDKENTLQFLQAENVVTDEIIKELLIECAKNERNIKFAAEKPVLDTLGVDLGIKNPVVRDVIILRCYKAVFNEQHHIKKAINLIKTEDDGTTYSSRRMFGGLLEIGFSSNEVSYIKETCNLYPISLLLERLDNKLGDEIEKENVNKEVPYNLMEELFKNVTDETMLDTITETEAVKIDVITPVEQPKTSPQFNLNNLIKMNEDVILAFLDFCGEYQLKTEKELYNYIENLKSRLEFVENMIKNVNQEAGEGIDVGYVLQKRDTLVKLFQVKKELEEN